MLPTPDLALDAGDILHVSATLPGIEALRERAAAPWRTSLMADARSMFVMIAGGGRTGAQLASFLVSQRHEVHGRSSTGRRSSPTSIASCRRR